MGISGSRGSKLRARRRCRGLRGHRDREPTGTGTKTEAGEEGPSAQTRQPPAGEEETSPGRAEIPTRPPVASAKHKRPGAWCPRHVAAEGPGRNLAHHRHTLPGAVRPAQQHGGGRRREGDRHLEDQAVTPDGLSLLVDQTKFYTGLGERHSPAKGRAPGGPGSLGPQTQ